MTMGYGRRGPSTRSIKPGANAVYVRNHSAANAALGGLLVEACRPIPIDGGVIGELLEHGRHFEELEPAFGRARIRCQARQPDGLLAIEFRRPALGQFF